MLKRTAAGWMEKQRDELDSARGKAEWQTRMRERKRMSGRQERLCGLTFSLSGAMVTYRAVAKRRGEESMLLTV